MDRILRLAARLAGPLRHRAPLRQVEARLRPLVERRRAAAFRRQPVVRSLVHGRLLELPAGHTHPTLAAREPHRESLLREAAAAFLGPGRDHYVDVGANIGDTAALVAGSAGVPAAMTLVEASDYWFPFLERNVRAMGLRAELVHRFVADGPAGVERPGSLVHVGGTAYYDPDAPGRIPVDRQVPLEALVRVETGLVKLDCDGMDTRILLVALPALGSRRPAILFEDHLPTDAAWRDHLSLMALAEAHGWTRVAIAHMTGGLIHAGRIGPASEDVFRWQRNLQLQGAEGAFHVDVLLATEGDAARFEAAIAALRRSQEPVGQPAG